MTNRIVTINQVDYTAVDFNLISVNKSTSPDYQKLGTIKMLVPNVLRDNSYKITRQDIEGAAEAKLIDELRSHINPVLSLIKDYTDGLEITPKNLHNGVDAFLRCSNLTFNFTRFEDINTLKQVKEHVENNPEYEEMLRKIMTYIVVAFKQEILKYAVNKEKAAAESRNKPVKASDGPFKIVALRVESKHFSEPLIFDVMTGYLNQKHQHPDTPINRFLMAFGAYKDNVASKWMKNVESGSMNHEARVTYAQQLNDLQELADILMSDEVTFTEVHRVPLPRYEREFSQHEFDIACSNLRKILYRTNAIKFTNMLDQWQVKNNTRHPDGVMH